MPVDDLQALAAIDCSNAFLPFGSEEIATPQRYHELCVALGESDFFGQRVRFHFGSEGETLEHAGYNDLVAMLADFRQLWMKREQTRFDKVLEMVRARAQPETRTASQQARRQLTDLEQRYAKARERPMMSFVDPRNPMNVIDHVPAERALDDWLYSGVFHLNKNKAARSEGWGATAYEYTITKIVHDYVGLLWELDIVVQGILNEPGVLAAAA